MDDLPTYTLRQSRDGDWVALYDPKGRKLAEGHSLDVRRVFEAVGLRLSTVEPEDQHDDDFFPEAI